MANIAYVRVSTEDQNLDRQFEDLRKANITIDKTFAEKISGKNMERPQLKAMMDYVREGDSLYIESYSRLARSTRDFLNIVAELQEKGVRIVSLKEQFDTSTPQGKFMVTVFSGLAELERDNIRERQAEGIAIAKAKGVYTGRKQLDYPEKWETVYDLWKKDKITAVKARELLNITHATFYRMVKRYEEGNQGD